MARQKVDVDHYPGDASRDCSCVALCPTPTGHAALIGFPWVPRTCKDRGGGWTPTNTGYSFSHLKVQSWAPRRRSLGPPREYSGY